MTGRVELDIDVPAARVAFIQFGSGAAMPQFEPPAPCGADVFTTAFGAAVTATQTAEHTNKALVATAEVAAAELGAENIATYEARDEKNRADLSNPTVFV